MKIIKYFSKKMFVAKNKESFLEKILLNFFLLFKSVKKNDEKIHLDENSKVLIINFGRIEDALVTTPLVSLLKEKTNCEIAILADKNNHSVFTNNPNVTNVIAFDNKYNHILKTVKQLNKNDYDVIIDSLVDVSAMVSLIVGFSKTKHKISFLKSNRKLFTHLIEKKKNIHIIDEKLSLANAFTFQYTKKNISVEYHPMMEARQLVIDFIIKNKLDRSKPLVGINVSAVSHLKYWGTDRFARLVKYLENYEVEVIILHSTENKDRAERIARKNCAVFNHTSFDEFTSMIYELDFLFTPDTAAVQLASSKNIPMFILYIHKATAKKWCPYNSNYDCVITEHDNFAKLSYGKTLNSFIPFFDNFYKGYNAVHKT